MPNNNPISHDLLKKQLLDVTDILDRAGVGYHLEGGTLLGIVRENRILPWDHDTDISIMRPDLPALLRLMPEFRRNGWIVRNRKTHKELDFATSGDIRLIKVKDQKWRFFSGTHCLDIFIKTRFESMVYWEAAECIMGVDQHFYDGFEEIDWEGRKLRVPCDYRAYLTEKYGDWSVPVKEWECAQELTVIKTDTSP